MGISLLDEGNKVGGQMRVEGEMRDGGTGERGLAVKSSMGGTWLLVLLSRNVKVKSEPASG